MRYCGLAQPISVKDCLLISDRIYQFLEDNDAKLSSGEMSTGCFIISDVFETPFLNQLRVEVCYDESFMALTRFSIPILKINPYVFEYCKENDVPLMSFVAHELTHAFLKGVPQSLNSCYNKVIEKLSRCSFNGDAYKVNRIFYLLDREERNAFMSQVQIELIHSENTVFRPYFRYICNTSSGSTYHRLFQIIDQFTKIKSKKRQSKILKSVNTVSNRYFSTWNQYRKWLICQKKKTQKKISKIYMIAFQQLLENKTAN